MEIKNNRLREINREALLENIVEKILKYSVKGQFEYTMPDCYIKRYAPEMALLGYNDIQEVASRLDKPLHISCHIKDSELPTVVEAHDLLYNGKQLWHSHVVTKLFGNK